MSSAGNSGLLNIDTGTLHKGACVFLVKTEWNAPIVDELEAGAIRVLNQHGIHHKTIIVPGCVEIPFAIKRSWENARANLDLPHAYIALGCVIQGDTPHFDYVCKMVADGVLQLNLSMPVPTIFGVLTVNNEQQALERIGGVHGHKGEEAAITAIKMID